ncbi:hypothetical protein [Halalkalibacterium halodurans]|uniref:Uncharacterized protein n=1 Tax=Halalkalibacterium halodurans TaxID=86665 RepID=A0A0M0KMP4_ALKHA|nr:hypothetical protein [Halalkalibacterium halodurans]TPE70678.1 hypothetical protein AMD02_001545 [Halalkalibacterium halodurans]
MNQQYLERVAQDLLDRITLARLNGQEVPILSKERQGTIITVLTGRQEDQTKMEHIALYDEQGGVITERFSNLDVSANRSLDFRFEFEVTS